VLVLTVPAALWLAVMSEPLVALLYEHGHFHAIDTTRTAGALIMFCVGLPAFAATAVLVRALDAPDALRTVVRASVVAVAVNAVLSLALIEPLGHLGLALATSLASSVMAVQLALGLRRAGGIVEGRRIATTLLRAALAGGIAAGACLALLLALRGAWHRGLVFEAATVLAGLVIGAGGAYSRHARVGGDERVLDDLVRR
jgi:putative peptidoglycan lipid II flippase